MQRRFVAQLIAVTSVFACSPITNLTKTAHVENRTTPRLRQSEHDRDLAQFLKRDGTSFTKAALKGSERRYDVTSYHLAGRFDWEQLRLLATVSIHLRLDDAESERIVLDSWVSNVTGVRLNGTLAPSFSVDPSHGFLSIDLNAATPEQRAGELVLDISYEAATSEPDHASNGLSARALRAISPRLGDPIAVRTLNTMSEPQSASEWMPCNDDPSDRALFSTEFTLPAQETFIANGTLTIDRTDERGTRTMAYATSYSLPTYLMAFAQSEFVKSETRIGDLPIAIYARRGLPIEAQAILAETSTIMRRYQELLGPFPFEKYAIIFLPEFGGGEEHAGITFQTEMWGTDPTSAGDLSMIAHEMAHQWFGDYMTVAQWDDLWIKEGMATLMESESGRRYGDYNHRNILFGSHFEVVEGEAVYDPSIPPNQKYNSGPYGHSAWVLSQLRAHIGDNRFFGLLRQLMTGHAYGTISTDEFIAAIDTDAGREIGNRIRRAIVSKKVPKLRFTGISTPRGDTATIALEDDELALILPLGIKQFTADGHILTGSVTKEQPLTLEPDNTRSLVVFDPIDVHPWSQFVFEGDRGTPAAVEQLQIPAPAFGIGDFLALPAHAQEASLATLATWLRDPEHFQSLLANAASEVARAHALAMACRQSAIIADPVARGAWRNALAPVLLNPPMLGMTSWFDRPRIASCGNAPGADVLSGDYERLIIAPANVDFSPSHVYFLGSLAQPHAQALGTIGNIARAGRSVRHRAAAARILGAYLDTSDALPPLSDIDRAAWKQFYRQLLEETSAAEVLRYGFSAVKELEDADAWQALATVIANTDFVPTQRRAVCTAWEVTQNTPDIFQAFASRVASTPNLHPDIAQLLSDRAGCETGH